MPPVKRPKQEVLDLTHTSHPLLPAAQVKQEKPTKQERSGANKRPKSEPVVIDLTASSPIKVEARSAPASTNSQLPRWHDPTIPLPDWLTDPLEREFVTYDEAEAAVYRYELQCGHQWIKGFTYRDPNGAVKEYTLTCNHYRHYQPTHSRTVDPREWRAGKTVKSGCTAHVNINRQKATGTWRITMIDLDHNHAPEMQPGDVARLPATEEQKNLIKSLACSTSQNYTRGHVAGALKASNVPGPQLRSKQLTNIMCEGRREKRNEHRGPDGRGGDIESMISDIATK
ncbi:hypothetical protein BKA70DRAFT_1108998, partial [Coprinopsis sp. MPI-PUGE-AT-0042]